MDKKPGLFIAISLLAIIVLATSFNMNLGGADAVVLKPGVNPADILYVCPVANNSWDLVSEILKFWEKYIYIGYIFAVIVLLFSWGWALYQNLLKDKFSADVYKNPWDLTKVFFWAGVICTVLTMTPNYFRTVHVKVKGHETSWVLCENNSEGAQPVKAQAVTLK